MRKAVVVFSMLLALAACGGDSVTAPDTFSPEGTWLSDEVSLHNGNSGFIQIRLTSGGAGQWTYTLTPVDNAWFNANSDGLTWSYDGTTVAIRLHRNGATGIVNATEVGGNLLGQISGQYSETDFVVSAITFTRR